MNRTQFGFLIGFFAATVWATAGFLVMIAALVAGLVGAAVAVALRDRVDVGELVDRVTARRS